MPKMNTKQYPRHVIIFYSYVVHKLLNQISLYICFPWTNCAMILLSFFMFWSNVSGKWDFLFSYIITIFTLEYNTKVNFIFVLGNISLLSSRKITFITIAFHILLNKLGQYFAIVNLHVCDLYVLSNMNVILIFYHIW